MQKARSRGIRFWGNARVSLVGSLCCSRRKASVASVGSCVHTASPVAAIVITHVVEHVSIAPLVRVAGVIPKRLGILRHWVFVLFGGPVGTWSTPSVFSVPSAVSLVGCYGFELEVGVLVCAAEAILVDSLDGRCFVASAAPPLLLLLNGRSV